MIDGTQLDYRVDLVFIEGGEVFPQGLEVLRTRHEEVARHVANSTVILNKMKRLHGRRGPGYTLRVQRVKRVIETTRDTILL